MDTTTTSLPLKTNDLSHLIDFFSDRTYDPVSDHSISLSPYGYRWFKAKRQP